MPADSSSRDDVSAAAGRLAVVPASAVDEAPAQAAEHDDGDARTENQARILRVAIREFAQKGLAGARVAEIAEQAGVNKQLLYYYFGSKDGLYSAVLSNMVTVSRNNILARSELQSLTEWFSGSLSPEDIERRRTLRRLWMWEALERGGQEILREEERREAWERAIDAVRDGIAREEIDPRLDPEMVMLAIDAVLNAPYMLPQVTKLISGMDPSDDAFRERLITFVGQMLEAFRPPRP
jgi:TetR/AcrR family transcriptional regulator